MSETSTGRQGGFFRMHGELYEPTDPQRSPWDPRAQNGIGIAGLLMHLAEQVPTPAPMLNVHMVIDLLGQTPFRPIEGRAVVTRPGKQMQMVEATLVDDGKVTARGRLLRVRKLGTDAYGDDPSPASCGPDGLPERPHNPRSPHLGKAVETRLAPLATEAEGVGMAWSRLRTNLIEGVHTSPMVHAAMLSDFGGGISNPMDRTKWISPNLDIAFHLTREPRGEWLLLEGRTVIAGGGAGLVNMVMGDRDGVFGRGHQTLFVAPVAKS